jgi:UDP-N-acetylmuramate--alanine ligase
MCAIMCTHMKRVKNIHFIGIGGSGMSGIAEVLLNQGYAVSGSDVNTNAAINRLQTLGAQIFHTHHADHVADADLIVSSSAIAKDNPEIQAAHAKRIPVLPRAQMLGELMRLQQGIAIAGTHGKTTTTSLVTSLLTKGGLDPTFVIGGLLNSAGTNARLGTGQYFVAEADESDASFLYLQPKMAIITNIDSDHMQTYNDDFDCLQQAFIKFLHNLPFYGLAVICIDDPVIKTLLPKIERPVITYGFDETADIMALDFKQVGTVSNFKVKFKNDNQILPIILNLPGKHNVLNSLAAIAIAIECGVSTTDICAALANFQGVGRRLQMRGEFIVKQNKILLVDDYGHHPREIAVTLQALRDAWPDRRLVLVFQPHRYSRTKALFDDFAQVLAKPDVMVLLDIYPAGEKPIAGISAKTLNDAIQKYGNKPPVFVEKISDLTAVLEYTLQDGDVLLMQGAGNIGAEVLKLVEKWEK